MKVINKFLRFTQLLASLVLIGGYFLHEPVMEFINQIETIQISVDLAIEIYMYTLIYVVCVIPLRWIVEKIVESKFMV